MKGKLIFTTERTISAEIMNSTRQCQFTKTYLTRTRPMQKVIGHLCCADTVSNMWKTPQATSACPQSTVLSLLLFLWMKTTSLQLSMPIACKKRFMKQKQRLLMKFRKVFLRFRRKKNPLMCSSAIRKLTQTAEEHLIQSLRQSFITSF